MLRHSNPADRRAWGLDAHRGLPLPFGADAFAHRLCA